MLTDAGRCNDRWAGNPGHGARDTRASDGPEGKHSRAQIVGFATGRDNRPMHLVVPYAAAASQAGAAALHGLRLPHLERLLSRLTPRATNVVEAPALNLPHEHVLAACRGWPQRDGHLPMAVWAAQGDGLEPAASEQGWGLMTPTHWHVGREQILLFDPAQLHLDEDESRDLLDALRSLFEPEGWSLRWGAPLRWYATHESLRELATASLDRVVGRAIDAWLPDRQAGRTLRRLQAEAQMLFHTHPVNAAREARGELAVNSFWLSGTGPTPSPTPADGEPVVDERLRASWLAEDWEAWVEAWQALDAQRLGECEARVARGEAFSLTLCGERAARRFDSVHRGAWQRLMQKWHRAAAQQVLEPL